MLLILLFLTWAVSRSKLGYYLTAGGEEPEAAQALGVNVSRAKVIAMALSCFFTALAGTFYAQFSLFIHPKSTISLDVSFEIAFIALIGGRGSIVGPVLGALLLRPVSDLSRIYFGDILPGMHLVIEHIMRSIMALSDRIVVIHFGKKIAEGTPETVASDENVIKAYLGDEYGVS